MTLSLSMTNKHNTHTILRVPVIVILMTPMRMNNLLYGSSKCVSLDVVQDLVNDVAALPRPSQIDMSAGYDLQLNVQSKAGKKQIVPFLKFKTQSENFVLHRKPSELKACPPYYLLDIPVASDTELRVSCRGELDDVDCLHIETFNSDEEPLFSRSTAISSDDHVSCACAIDLNTDYTIITLDTNVGSVKLLCQAVDNIHLFGSDASRQLQSMLSRLHQLDRIRAGDFGSSLVSIPGRKGSDAVFFTEAEAKNLASVTAAAIDKVRDVSSRTFSADNTHLSCGFYGSLDPNSKCVFDLQASSFPFSYSDINADDLRFAVKQIKTGVGILRSCAVAEPAHVVQDFHDVYKQYASDVSWTGVDKDDPNLANVVNARAKQLVLSAIEDLASRCRGVHIDSYTNLSRRYQLAQMFTNNHSNSVQLSQDVFDEADKHLARIEELAKLQTRETATTDKHPLLAMLFSAACVRGELFVHPNVKCKHQAHPPLINKVRRLPHSIDATQRQALTDLVEMLHTDNKNHIINQGLFNQCMRQIDAFLDEVQRSTGLETAELSADLAVDFGKLMDPARYNLIQAALMGVVLDSQATAQHEADAVLSKRSLDFVSRTSHPTPSTGYVLAERTARSLALLQ